MNFLQLTATIKRIESLLANALRKSASGAIAFLTARNDVFSTNVAPIAVATVPSWDFGSFTPSTQGPGKVKIRAMMTVSIAGGTAVAGEQIQFTLRKNGSAMAGAPVANVEIGATRGFASATLVWEDSGLTPGVAIPQGYGIQATNITTGAHTQGVPTSNAVIEIEERP